MHREHSQVKPSPAGGRQLAIYKDGSAVELRQLRKKKCHGSGARGFRTVNLRGF